jgi:dTDP-4-dehydrorhamnose 3,5-epimerase-like enzyme
MSAMSKTNYKNNLENVEVIKRISIQDERGKFLKLLSGFEKGLSKIVGELYLVIGYPGQIRGRHYHKNATEWFTIIYGEATLILVCTKTGSRKEIKMNADDPTTVKVPPMIAHTFFNSGQNEFYLIAYTDCKYEKSDTLNYEIT